MSDLPSLLICSFDLIPSPTGTSRRLSAFVKALREHFNIVLITVKSADHPHVERYHGARLLRVPVGEGDVLSRADVFSRAVRRQLESEDYVAVHVTDPFSGVAVCEHRPQGGYRILYDAQTLPSQELPLLYPALARHPKLLDLADIEQACLGAADSVLTGSHVTRAFLEKRGAKPGSVNVLRSPVDLAPFERVSTAGAAAWMRALYLGSQARWQGVETLLRAFKMAREETGLSLAIVGPRPAEGGEVLDKLIHELALDGEIDFRPAVAHDQLHDVISPDDVGIIPLEDKARNRSQGGPLSKLSELLAAGRPVIAADLPLTRELVPEGAGMFYRPGDVKALAQCLIELAESQERRTQLAAAARAASATVDVRSVTQSLLGIYNRLLGARVTAARTDPQFDAPTVLSPPPREPDTQLGTTVDKPPAKPPPSFSATMPYGTPLRPGEVVSNVDYWLAQVVQGYCSPEGAAFIRHPPPTTFPGRDEKG